MSIPYGSMNVQIIPPNVTWAHGNIPASNFSVSGTWKKLKVRQVKPNRMPRSEEKKAIKRRQEWCKMLDHLSDMKLITPLQYLHRNVIYKPTVEQLEDFRRYYDEKLVGLR